MTDDDFDIVKGKFGPNAPPDRLCQGCGHPFGDHRLVAEFGDPIKGGTISCPVPECTCYGTWSVDESMTEEQKKELYDSEIWKDLS